MSGAISDPVRVAWDINSRVNQAVLGELGAEGLHLPVGTGWTVAQHLAHMTEAKTYWTARVDERVAERVSEEVGEEVGRRPNALAQGRGEVIPLPELRAQFAATERAVLDVMNRTGDPGRLPFATPDLFLLHLTHHDAHHRALILSALRHAGQAVPNDAALWGPWRVGGKS